MSENPKFSKGSKKLLENPVVGSLMVPIAIVLVGAFIIFGVTKLLSSEQSYKDLVREMQSKTFGNRWIAAYELSKVISSKQVPEEDIPWLVQNLSSIYSSSSSPQTREFVITALGALKSPLSLKTLEDALDDQEPKVQFQALVALGNMSKGLSFNWNKVTDLLNGEDLGLSQAAILTLSTHRVDGADEKIIPFLTHARDSLRYSAALSLINYKRQEALPVLKEILLKDYPLDTESSSLSKDQLEALKLNLLSSLKENKWDVLNETLHQVSTKDKSVSVAAKARSLLNILKN